MQRTPETPRLGGASNPLVVYCSNQWPEGPIEANYLPLRHEPMAVAGQSRHFGRSHRMSAYPLTAAQEQTFSDRRRQLGTRSALSLPATVGCTSDPRDHNFADKSFFAPIKANLPPQVGDHSFNHSDANAVAGRLLHGRTTCLCPA